MSDATQVEDVFTRPSSPQGPEQELSDRSGSADTERNDTHNRPESQEHAGTNSTGPHVEPAPASKYPSRVRQQPQRYM